MNQRALQLSRALMQEMQGHVEQRSPLEACGLLAGKGMRAMRVYLIKNMLNSPVRFRMDTLEQLRAFEAIESDGLELVAIFHSHPAGPAVPSPTDIEEAYYQVFSIIWSPQAEGWLARAFWIESGCVAEVPIKILEV